MRPIYELRCRAFTALGITEQQVAEGVQVTPHLKAIAATMRRAGQPKTTTRVVLPANGDVGIKEKTKHLPPYGPGSDVARSWPWYLQASADPDAKKILDAYYAIYKSQRAVCPIEAFCHAAKLSPLRALEIITAVCVRLGAQASTIVAAVNHPRIVQKTVEMALTDEGVEDRNTLHKAVGFLPASKGSQTNITIAANASAASTAQSASVAAPPAEQTIRRLVNRFNERALPEDVGLTRLPEVMPHEDIEHGGDAQEAATLIAEHDEDEYSEEEEEKA